MKHHSACLRVFKTGLGLLLTLTLATSSARALAENTDESNFLSPEQAFSFQLEKSDKATLRAHWKIAPGYHLYKEKIQIVSTDRTIVLSPPTLPDGIRKYDDNFQKEVDTYEGELNISFPLPAFEKNLHIDISYQGCADQGLCYPPQTHSFQIVAGSLDIIKGTPPEAATINTATNTPTTAAPQDEVSLAQKTLASGKLLSIGGAFLLFGLLLSFTPCVLPMVPILSSIIAGEKDVTRARGFLLALAYCLGMALVYTCLGIAAGLAGEGLAGALQKPWVLICFASLLLLLALSMFDIYQLQLPASLQTRLSQSSGQLNGGRFFAVFLMGALSALIVGPCVAGPLAGALLYISQTRNVVTGGWALFSMAMGMSVPLLLTGISAGSILPRAGVWMNQVKKFFGVLLIAVAIWMINPLLTPQMAMIMWGALALFTALLLHVFAPLSHCAGITHISGKLLGILFFLLGLSEILGALGGGQNLTQPLAHWRATAQTLSNATHPANNEPHFQRLQSTQELDQQLAQTQQAVLLDFYADWCVACKEMENFTFSDPKVRSQLAQMKLLQIDVTKNTEQDRALMKRYQLFAPPGIILFKSDGTEAPDSRIIGFRAAKPFQEHLSRHLNIHGKPEAS